MIIKTYDSILNSVCNEFDKLISPKRIRRSNSNIIYLLLKAYAKGNEVLHNSLVALSNKFDPVNCEDEDLESIAKLVGTAKYLGSSSGLKIKVKNTSKIIARLEPGTYIYQQDADTIFTYINMVDTDLQSQGSTEQIFMSNQLKPIKVTAQTDIKVKGIRPDGSIMELADGLIFSCSDNEGLQGAVPESNLEFRQRIVSGTNTATLFNKMETEINNLPYIYSCRLVFNDSTSPLQVGNITLEPYKLLLVISGVPDEKVAEIVASYGVYETHQEDPGKYVDYKNDIFVTGYHRIYYMQPEVLKYSLRIKYEVDASAVSTSIVEQKMKDSLQKFKDTNDYVKLITERDFSNYLMNLGINTLQVLDVDLYIHEGEMLDYIKVDKTKVALLDKIEFVPEV